MNEKKVFSFMEEVELQKQSERAEEEYEQSTDYKLSLANSECDKARGICLDTIISNLYKDALPLDNEYKTTHNDELSSDMKDFIRRQCPKGTEYYIHEQIQKGNPIAAKMMEKSDKFANDEYYDKRMNIETTPKEDLVFQSTDADIQKKINVIGQDLDMDAISEVISDNVKSTALSEIERAKTEKRNLIELEKELAKDPSVTSEEAIEYELGMRDMAAPRDFKPTLFQGIMIGKLDKLQTEGTDEPVFLFNALNEFGMENPDAREATLEEVAFIESVKELTKLNILNALKFENFSSKRVSDLAYEYASGRR